MPIINYKVVAERDLNNLLNDKKISNINKKNLQKYLNAKDQGPARIGIICRHITFLFHKIPDVVGSMDDRDLVNKTFKELQQQLKPGYFETIKSVACAFVRWHNDGEKPKGWKDIKSGAKKAQRRDLRPEDMITWEDGLKMAEQTNSIQIKAILLTQLDGGFRPSEFVELNFGDVKITKGFGSVHVKMGKTGKRDVTLFRCVPILQKWLKAHPTKKAEDPLWMIEYKNMSHKKGGSLRYSYQAIRKRISTLGEAAHIKKPLDFYNLRHSACYLSKMDNVTTDLAARKFGHSVEFYTETYGRLSPEDDIKRYSRHYGVGKDKKKNEEDNPITCPRCDTVNEPGVLDCETCGSPLTMERALEKGKETEQLREELTDIKKMLKAYGLMKKGGLVK